MNKKTIITLLLVLVTLTGWAKEKARVWEQPTTEYGTSYGDGFFNLALDVTKVELKETETVVYITAMQRSDYPDFSFQFVGDTYLKVGETHYSLTSAEEYARLKDYDIEFLYLANRSPQESWENVIKEYNVSGPNVAHYNLPALQQNAIERHLDVHSFPTYKLFNREGHLLDLEIDARNLDELAHLLEQMK